MLMAKKKTIKKTPSSNKKLSTPKNYKKQKIIFGSLLMLLSIALFIAFISFFYTWKFDPDLFSKYKKMK